MKGLKTALIRWDEKGKNNSKAWNIKLQFIQQVITASLVLLKSSLEL